MITIIAPLDSSPTTVTYEAGKRIYEILGRSEDVRLLPHAFATHFSWRLAEILRRSEFVIYLGHGEKNALLGQLPWGLIRALLTEKDERLADERKFINVACYSLWVGRLVPHEWWTGSRTFMTVGFPSLDHDYSEDFIDTFVTLAITAVKKDDPVRAVRVFKERCTRYITEYERGRYAEWDTYSYYMRINRDYYGWL